MGVGGSETDTRRRCRRRDGRWKGRRRWGWVKKGALSCTKAQFERAVAPSGAARASRRPPRALCWALPPTQHAEPQASCNALAYTSLTPLSRFHWRAHVTQTSAPMVAAHGAYYECSPRLIGRFLQSRSSRAPVRSRRSGMYSRTR